MVLPLTVTTKINRRKPNCFLLQSKLADLSGASALSCRALSGITLSGSRSLLRVCTQSVPSCFLSCRRYLPCLERRSCFPASHPSFYSHFSTHLTRASQCLRAGGRTEPCRCSLWRSNAVVRDRSAEFSGAS